MHLAFAPMEGITSCVYRRVHHELFPGADVYYSPFIAPDSRGNFKLSHLRGLLPDNNMGIRLVPQILANHAGAFNEVAGQMADLGYPEVNLNAGCPSATVVSKHKGSGMLADLDSLQAFLDEVFGSCRTAVSVKTRMGMNCTEEFERILEIYNRYPICELIIHARDRKGGYQSEPDREGFARACRNARMPVTYNGNLLRPGDAACVRALAPETDRFMLGRGAVANPALFRQLRGGAPLAQAELREFHDRILEESLAEGLSPNFAVMRMKELWFYMIHMFPGSDRAFKVMNKATRLEDFRSAANTILLGPCFDPGACFHQKLK